MRRKDLFTKQFNILDVALEDSHGQWLDRWSAEDAVGWARQAKADGINLMIVNEWGQAYFQSEEVRPHPQLDGTDRLAEMIEAAHKADLVLFGMWGPSCNPIVSHEHPDWTQVKADGSPYQWGKTQIAPCECVCLRSPYGAMVLRTLKDLYRRYEIDGVCFDFFLTEPCFCPACRKAVKAELTLDLDQIDGWSRPDRARYDLWREAFHHGFAQACTRLADRFGRIQICFYGRGSHFYFCEPHTGGHITIRDKGFIIRQQAAIARADKRRLVLCTPYAHQYYIGLPKPPAHMRQEFREITVSGDLNHWPVAWDWELVQDPSGLAPLSTVLDEATRLSRYTRGSRGLPHVALWNSRETLASPDGHRPLHADGVKGFYDLLTRAHIPVELVHSDPIKPADLKDYDLLILSNVACLSDAQAETIRTYVRRGGNVVATYQTSLYDEQGRTRYDFALSDLFGGHFTSQVDEPWSYIAASDREGLGKGFRKGSLLLHGDYAAVRAYLEEERTGRPGPIGDAPAYPNAQCIVEPFGGAKAIAEIWNTRKRYGTYFFKDEAPPQPGSSTGHPAVLVNRFGKGTVYYMAGQVDRVFYRIGHADHERFLLNLVGLAAGDPPMQVIGPKTVEATYVRKGRTILVHLLNHTYDAIYPVQAGTMGQYGDFTHDAFRPVTEVVPVTGLKLRIHMKGRIASVSNGLTGESYAVSRRDGVREIRLPELAEYLAVVIKLGA